MKKLLNVPFVILTISLVLGIILGYYISISLRIAIILQTASITGLTISWWYANRIFRSTIHFSGLVIITFFFFGTTLVELYHPKNDPFHFTNRLNNSEPHVTFEFSVKKRLKSTSFYDKYIISLTSLENNKVTGDVLLKLPNKSLKTKLITGTSYLTYALLKPIPKPLNPNQFNYASYMGYEYVYYQTTIDFKNLILTDKTNFSLYRLADIIRADIFKNLSNYTFTGKQLAIINALILGQKQDIDIDTFKDYQNAGATHILAVSGLHIGILLILLNFLLKPLDYIFKRSRELKIVLTIIALWSFAIIAGLSPSILRAATMFSFITIGTYFRSKTSIYNALIISIFILVILDPLLIFSVGFQLSYVAVFSIIWMQPHLVKIYKPRFYIDKILWETLTVTITAQIGLLPLLLFYFHQFPLLFIISNLIIIPILGIVLGLGILVILLAKIHLLTDWIVMTYGNLIDFINTIIHWVAAQKAFIIKDISFSSKILVSGYLLTIVFIQTLRNYHIKRLFALSVVIALFLSVLVYEKKISHKVEELIVFHNPRNTIIGVSENQQLKIFSKDSITDTTIDFLIRGHVVANNFELSPPQILHNIYTYKDKRIFIIDENGIYDLPNFKADIILLINSPKIHLDKVIEQIQPEQIIADGSNYRSYLDRWESTCLKQKIPFHRTDKKGAYILK
ncbi:ComEC/Rec2 family competence protein [Aquimarina litoralis]|uniref:ComEC/Rec2 family competence protein n=1 Tax=Aquimarina litoralis TaxID=584605 RepID=A0ABP3TW74_9FLAO